MTNGDNSIVIVGGANAAFDPLMQELDPKWEETIKTSNFKFLIIQFKQAKSYFCSEKFLNT